jgi:uncharacterized membrane protein YwzB
VPWMVIEESLVSHLVSLCCVVWHEPQGLRFDEFAGPCVSFAKANESTDALIVLIIVSVQSLNT